jgi:hypothetical protein
MALMREKIDAKNVLLQTVCNANLKAMVKPVYHVARRKDVNRIFF